MMTLTLVLALSTLAAALFAAFRSRPVDWGPLERPLEKMERALRDEIARSRAESALTQGQELATLRATVEDRLDEVHRGLGEMQSLAAGVGDLKKILSNVKLRGGWGEVQLGALLDQMLAPERARATGGRTPARRRRWSSRCDCPAPTVVTEKR